MHTKTEYRANCTAIDILLSYCYDNDIEIDNPITFCEQFGVPINFEYIVSLKLKELM